MPSKEPRTCPICQCSSIINLSQHLNGVHQIGGQQRKQLIQRNGQVESKHNRSSIESY